MQGRRSGGQGARFYAALCIVSCDPEARGQRQRRQLTPFTNGVRAHNDRWRRGGTLVLFVNGLCFSRIPHFLTNFYNYWDHYQTF